MQNNKLVTPFVKWAGGKRQLLPVIQKYLPKTFTTYYEPFVGGGALLFHLQPQKAVLNDFNEELVNVYRVIKENPQELVTDLKKHKNNAEYFYAIRELDRKKDFKKLSNIERASRVIYLNKTCYNGLYRVNSAGEFNSPFGNYKNPNVANERTILAVSKYLNDNNITILRGDFADAVKNIKKNAFVYFDPPYHPLSASANFTGYVQGGFDEQEQIRLRDLCIELDTKGVKFLLSNSATSFTKELYQTFTVDYVKANRFVNSVAKKRAAIDEILVRNYE